ncbi:MAG: hypothetical protein HYV63_30785 [Candidatus Schekmanbacteria bacterium]|nr:hypothetical protein [Candidatus Schekmanbacteria bacterium]
MRERERERESKDDAVTVREITHDPVELERYRERGAALWGGIRLPIEYLQQGRVFALYRGVPGSPQLGGFALILRPPLRTVRLLPAEVRSADPVLGALGEEAILEITGVWIDPETRDRRVSWLLWRHLTQTALKARKPYSIYGYDGSVAGLRRLYEPLRGRRLFAGDASGRADVSGGPSHRSLELYIFPTARLRWAFWVTAWRGWWKGKRSGGFTRPGAAARNAAGNSAE